MITVPRPDQQPSAPTDLPPVASTAERADFARGRAILEALIEALPPLRDDAGSPPPEQGARG